MQLDAFARVSLQTNGPGNNDVRVALTGALSAAGETGPFHWAGTGFYQCRDEDAADVGLALSNLGQVLSNHAATIDHVFVSMARTPAAPGFSEDDTNS